MLIIYFCLLSLNLVLCFALLRLDTKIYSPAAILWFVLASSFLIPSIADPFVGTVAAHPLSVVYDLDIFTLVEAQSYVLLFLSIFIFVYIVRKTAFRSLCELYSTYYGKQLTNSTDSGLLCYTFFLMLAFFGFYEAYNKFGNDMFSSFSFIERREGLSVFSGFLLSYNLLVSAGILFWLVMNRKIFASTMFLMAYLVIYLVLGGSRQPLIVLFLPFVFYFFYSRKFGYFYMVFLSLFFSVISKVLEFVIYVRNISGFNSRLDALLEFPSFLFSMGHRLGSREEDLRYGYYYFVKNFKDLDGFGEFSYFQRVLFFWLPSSLDGLELKPSDFEYKMFSHYMPGYEGTMHPTLFGTIYSDSGWMVLPWMVFFVFLLLVTSPVLKCYRGIPYFSVWALFGYAYMMMARGAIYGPFVVLVFGLIFAALVQKISRIGRR
ncbi:hypothetical protein [Pseudomonas corrugata]|uniref:hypothetical protein n=1 Tax=Pseudomonas corrugata TaxID=47879 RepID=UPI002234AF4F|nr:hypothetical protein [Pseudomonas corrugata]UZE07939.1 hypothetical protein LOY65_08500 [Pseudomonas corrugata]